jgi:putative NADPH-quinone reductase
MGMPALVYRFYFRAHSVRSLERNVLGHLGFSPIDETLIGRVAALDDPALVRWLATMRRLGRLAV